MAKKRRKDDLKKEDEYEFVPPEFDERSFLNKDIQGTKTLMVSALLAVTFGVVAFGLSLVNVWLGFLALIVGGVILRYSYTYLKIDRKDVGRNTELGNIALYVLLFLGIWILLMNPPFSA